MDDTPLFDGRLAASLERWKADPTVLGVGLHGSRGAGTQDADSDYDVLFLVTEADEDTETRLCPDGKPLWDPWSLTIPILEEMRDRPDGYSPTMLDVAIVFDRTGDFTRILSTFGDLPPDKARAGAESFYDAYLNAFVRSVKAHRKGDRFGAHLQAGASVRYLLTALFALNGRMTPYHDRLHRHWRYLVKTPCPIDELTARIARILTDADPVEQARLSEKVEALMVDSGIVIDWPDFRRERTRALAR